jgi:hypothetical protein
MNPLWIVLGLGALGAFGYRRYKQVKPGDRVRVHGFIGPDSTDEVTILSERDADHWNVRFQPPPGPPVPTVDTACAKSSVVENLTPRLL